MPTCRRRLDRIDHTWLDARIVPGRDMIAGWLKAGVIEDGIFTPTEEGTPWRRDQPADDERGAPWAGRGRGSPVPNLRPPCRGHLARLSDLGQIR